MTTALVALLILQAPTQPSPWEVWAQRVEQRIVALQQANVRQDEAVKKLQGIAPAVAGTVGEVLTATEDNRSKIQEVKDAVDAQGEWSWEEILKEGGTLSTLLALLALVIRNHVKVTKMDTKQDEVVRKVEIATDAWRLPSPADE